MKAKTRAKKVRRIFRFQERFELPDDVRYDRKRPLAYIRYYVGSGQDDESINFKRQIAACKANQRRHILLAVFNDLLEIAANYSKAYRGYILDENFRPAGIAKIAGWVGLRVDETGEILRKLEQIGLIEIVSMPEFDLSVNGDRGEKTKSRARTENPGKPRAPLKNKGKSESGNGKGKRNKKTGKEPESEKGKEQTLSQAQFKSQDQQTSNPTNNPKESDDQVGNDKLGIRINNPPGQSLSKQYRQTEKLGGVLHKLYDPEADEFAMAVYKAIGTHAKDEREKHSELACWKNAWAKAQLAGIAPSYLTALWDRVMREAEKLHIKRRRKIQWRNSPEAVLRWLFDRLLADAKRRAGLESKRAISTG